MEKKIKLIVDDWGRGSRYIDSEGNLCPSHQAFTVYESEVKDFVRNDYESRLAMAGDTEKDLVRPRTPQEILQEQDRLEYNNEKKHERGKMRLVAKLSHDDPLLKTIEQPFEYELERAMLPTVVEMMNKIEPLLSEEEKKVLREVVLLGRMNRREFARLHHVSPVTIGRKLRRALKLSRAVVKEELAEFMEY